MAALTTVKKAAVTTKAQSDDTEAALCRKVREICEYTERTGDWGPVRKIQALLSEANRMLGLAKAELTKTRTPQRQPQPKKKRRKKA